MNQPSKLGTTIYSTSRFIFSTYRYKL